MLFPKSNDIKFFPLSIWHYSLYLMLAISIVGLCVVDTYKWLWLTWFGWIILFNLGSIVLHRYFTHRAFKMALWKEKIASVLCLFCLSGSPRRYVPAHLLHHRYPDTADDPHSPHYVGIIAPLTFRYRDWPHVEEDIPRNLNTDFHRFLDKVWFWPVVLFEYSLLFVQWEVAVFGFMLPTLLLLYSQALGAIIGGHLPHFGSYRVYDTPDTSVNSIPSFFLAMSEAWHNNHHQFPNDPNFGRKWWELDPSYWLILLIRDNESTD